MGAHVGLRKPLLFTLLALGLALSPAISAEEPFPTSLDSSEARDFIGDWALAVDMQGREINFTLKVVDLEGKVGATIDSARQPEPLAIENIEIDERGHLVLQYPMQFGQQSFDMTVVAELVPEGLEGTIDEASGLFSARFTGKEAVDDPEAREARRRSRRMAANMSRLRLGDDTLRVNFHPLKVGSEDHARLEKLEEGDVFEYVAGRATKLFTDVDMQFTQAVVETENAAPNYPGVYSLWLRKTADGWNLVFNEEADVWGTMYNPETTVAEVPLELGTASEPSDTFKIDLEETATGGLLKITWGDQQWTAPFEVEGFSGDMKTAAITPPDHLVGKWTLDAESALGPLSQELEVSKEGTLSFQSDGQASEIRNFKAQGDSVSFDVTIQGYDVTFKGTVNGDSIEGNYEMNGNPVATVTGSKMTGTA